MELIQMKPEFQNVTMEQAVAAWNSPHASPVAEEIARLAELNMRHYMDLCHRKRGLVEDMLVPKGLHPMVTLSIKIMKAEIQRAILGGENEQA